jgi:hypothetical protein
VGADRRRLRCGRQGAAPAPAVGRQRARLGEERGELVTAQDGALALTHRLCAGSWVALHWDWICDVLEPARFARLSAYTRTQLVVVNHALSRPTAAAVLG